jgi:pSer/pThr/pTyr-binding forkhead associated (FHA) protein
VSIGRSEGDLQLPSDPMVSSRHGEIVVTNDGRLLYVDNSRNGSMVDGRPVHRTQVEITTASKLEIGGSQVEIIAARLPMPIAPPQAPAPAPKPSMASTMVSDEPTVPVAGAKTGIFLGVELVVVSGPDTGKRFPVGKTTITIGRRDDQDLVLADGFVSREHLVIVQQGAQWTLKNKSDRGTIVNGERVDEAVLASGDRIAAGTTVIEFNSLVGAAPTVAAAAPPTATGAPPTIVDDEPTVVEWKE